MMVTLLLIILFYYVPVKKVAIEATTTTTIQKIVQSRIFRAKFNESTISDQLQSASLSLSRLASVSKFDPDERVNGLR